MKKFLAIIVLLLMLPIALATTEDFLAEVETGTELPGPLANIFGNERINVYVGDSTIGIVTNDGSILSANDSEIADSTIRFYIPEDLFNQLTAEDGEIRELAQAVRDGTVTYEADGFVRRVKMRLALRLLSRFG